MPTEGLDEKQISTLIKKSSLTVRIFLTYFFLAFALDLALALVFFG